MLLTPLAAWSGWAWLGLDGAVLLMIWWWLRRPLADEAPGYWVIDLARVRSVRLGAWRTRVVLRGRGAIEIFHDEIAAPDLARLRRVLKHQLAAG